MSLKPLKSESLDPEWKLINLKKFHSLTTEMFLSNSINFLS